MGYSWECRHWALLNSFIILLYFVCFGRFAYGNLEMLWYQTTWDISAAFLLIQSTAIMKFVKIENNLNLWIILYLAFCVTFELQLISFCNIKKLNHVYLFSIYRFISLRMNFEFVRRNTFDSYFFLIMISWNIHNSYVLLSSIQYNLKFTYD